MKRDTTPKEYYTTQLKQLPLYSKWADLIYREMPKFFPAKKLERIVCPGCGKANCPIAFTKNGFTYERCGKCGSLFVSPRPTEAMLQSFYQNSRAMKFWKREIMQSTITVRKTYQISPITNWLGSIMSKYFGNAKIHAIDYKPCIATVWNNEKLKTNSIHLTLTEPTLFTKIKSIKGKGSIRITHNLASIPHQADVITAFGVLEQVYDPKNAIAQIAKKCRRGGVFLMTTNTMSGFEYQILGQHSHRIVPPYRLNLLTIEAIKNLLTKEGFEIIHCSTPGKLDVEIVADTVRHNNKIALPEFFKYLFTQRDQKILGSFQDFLQLSNLSSHLRIAARKL